MVGLVLGQRKDKKPCVIYYASRTLDEVKQNYTTTEKELFTIMCAIEKLQPLTSLFQGHCVHGPLDSQAPLG